MSVVGRGVPSGGEYPPPSLDIPTPWIYPPQDIPIPGYTYANLDIPNPPPGRDLGPGIPIHHLNRHTPVKILPSRNFVGGW